MDSDSLFQGIQYNSKYKHKQNKNKHNKSKYIGKEGFDDGTASSDAKVVADLQSQMNNLLTQLQTAEASTNTTIQNYITNTSSQNKFLNNNIVFSTGQYGYVTGQAVLRLYSSADIYNANIGVNGCPSSNNTINADFPWPDPSIIAVGQPITTGNSTIQLTMGTPITNIGESCGNEGTNVFVNSLIANPTATYQGCYADNAKNHVMTYLGNKPSQNIIKLINGNFNNPKLTNNSYKYINDSTTVPGWTVNAPLINNSTDWKYKLPYPEGQQAVSLQNLSNISQTVNLIPGTYTLKWNSIGRSTGSNLINVYCNVNTISPAQTVTTSPIFTYTPTNAWNLYSTPITISTTGNYTIGFYGTIHSPGDGSSAIQNIRLSTSSDNGQPDYTYDTCETAAIQNGYQYFALQNVNSSNMGYCGVSNDSIAITANGISNIPTKLTAIWSSGTTGQGNYAQLTDTGSLVVMNSNGANIFTTPASITITNNYVGCYVDHSTKKQPRAMTQLSNDRQTLDACNQLAISQNMSYYAIQNQKTITDSSNNKIYAGGCFGSNNLPTATKYGLNTNCAAISSSDSRITGRGWSNAIYSLSPGSNFFLVLQDDGNMCIYLGSSPLDNQGFVWHTKTNGKQQDPNPNMTATNSKYGLNYMTSSTGDLDTTTDQVLYPGDFIASTTGTTYLIMQEDGNLVLYTTTVTTNCSIINNIKNIYGGGIGANAIYNLNEVAYPAAMGKFGYVDPGSNLLEYPTSMINNNIPNPDSSCNTKVVNIDSVQWLNYLKGALMMPTTQCSVKALTNPQTEQITSLRQQLADVSTQLIQKLNSLETQNDTLNTQINTENTTLLQNAEQYKINAEKILAYSKQMPQVGGGNGQVGGGNGQVEGNGKVEGYENLFLDNIVSDSTINSTQRIYSYIIWSIIATILVLITINLFLNNEGSTLKIVLIVSIIIILMNALFREYALLVNILIIVMFIFLSKMSPNKQIPE